MRKNSGTRTPWSSSASPSGSMSGSVGHGGAFEQAIDEFDVVVDLDTDVGAAKGGEVAAELGRRAHAGRAREARRMW